MKTNWLVQLCLLITVTLGWSTGTAFAQSQTYAIVCSKASFATVDDTNGHVGCADAGAVPSIAATGSAAANVAGAAVAIVDCGSSDPKADKPLTKFTCKDGSKPSINVTAQGGSNQPNSTTDCTSGVCSSDPAIACASNNCDLIKKYVDPAINLLSLAFGVIAAISIVMGGMQYSASTGDPQKISAAKSRITNTMIAIVAYIFLYSFLQFLVPGGIFNR